MKYIILLPSGMQSFYREISSKPYGDSLSYDFVFILLPLKCFLFLPLTQPITWFPLTFVFIFFSQQKYLFFLLSILEIVSQGMTLMKGEASVLTRWTLLVDWLLLASTRQNCGLSPLSGSSPLNEAWHWQRKRGPTLTPLLTHHVTWRHVASPLVFFFFLPIKWGTTYKAFLCG